MSRTTGPAGVAKYRPTILKKKKRGTRTKCVGSLGAQHRKKKTGNRNFAPIVSTWTDQRTQHPEDGGSWTGVAHKTVDLGRLSGDDGDGIVSGPQRNLRQSCDQK